MKIPLEWLKEYVDINKSPKEVSDSFTLLGLLLDKPIEMFESEGYSTAVLDLEHRMDRSDWLGITGCARDYAAFEKLDLKAPPAYSEQPRQASDVVQIKVEKEGFVNRFNTLRFNNITVKESPNWLKNRLEAYGIPSINNIVDITNYVMLEYGQPMHAHDIDKMEKPEIEFRTAKEGEKITTLLGEEKILDTDTWVTSNNNKPTGIAGIVGGKMLEIDSNTKNIILDAGNYNQNIIRKTSRRLKIQNETVLRTDKFLHPHSTQVAVMRAAKLILDLAGGEVYTNQDYYPVVNNPKIMNLRYSRLEKIGGISIETHEIKDILTRLEYKVISETQEGLELETPYFRTDIEVEDDLVADVLRINNYENIPVTMPHEAPPKEITPQIYDFEEKLRDILVSMGLHEHITDPLVEYNENNSNQILLKNALTQEKSSLRTSILKTLRPVINIYKKHNTQNIGLFEIGKVYLKEDEDYIENRHAVVLTHNKSADPKFSLKVTKRYMATLLRDIGITDYKLVKKSMDTADILIESEIVGNINLDSFYINTQKLLKYYGSANRVVSELTNLTTENLSLICTKDQSFGEVYWYIKNYDDKIVNVRVLEEFMQEDSQNKKVLVELAYTTSETQTIRNGLIKNLKDNFNIDHLEA